MRAAEKSKRMVAGDSCHIHGDRVAVAVCSSCNKAICSECASKTSYPHVCPSCYPKEYGRKMKKWQDLKKKGLVTTAIIAAAIVLLMLTVYAVYPMLKETTGPQKEDGCARVLLYSDDIYPTLEQGPSTSDEVAFRLYMTNQDYDRDGKGLDLEILILHKGVIVSQVDETLNDVEKGSSLTKTTTTFSLPLGEYDVQFILWQQNRISVVTSVTIKVVEDDVQLLTKNNNEFRAHPLDLMNQEVDDEIDEEPRYDMNFVLIELLLLLLLVCDLGAGAFLLFYQPRRL